MYIYKYVYMITKHSGQVDRTLLGVTRMLTWHYAVMEDIELPYEHYYAGDNAESKRIMNQTFERELAQLVNYDLPRIPALLSDVLLSRGLSLDFYGEISYLRQVSPPVVMPTPNPTTGYMRHDQNTIIQLHNLQRTLNDCVTYFTAIGEARLLPRE